MGWFTNNWYDVLGEAVDDENLNLYNGSLLVALTITVVGLAQRLYESSKNGGGNASVAGGIMGRAGGPNNDMAILNDHFFDGMWTSVCMAGATIGGYMVTSIFLGTNSPSLGSETSPGVLFMKIEDPADLALEVSQALN